MQSETITRTKRWRVQWVTLCDLVAGITQQCEIWRRLQRLCSDDSDFSSKSEEMCQFEKRGYPVSVVKAGHHCAQQFDRQSALQTSQKDKSNRIPFTLTFHPHNHAVKSIILNNFKLLQNDPETGRIFSQPPLDSFKHDKNVGNFFS